jgi:hypothetical protein
MMAANSGVLLRISGSVEKMGMPEEKIKTVGPVSRSYKTTKNPLGGRIPHLDQCQLEPVSSMNRLLIHVRQFQPRYKALELHVGKSGFPA